MPPVLFYPSLSKINDRQVSLQQFSLVKHFLIKYQIGLKLDVIEVRFDYMSTSVLMGRVSHLVVRMKDDWHVTDVKDSSTMKPAQIFVQVSIP